MTLVADSLRAHALQFEKPLAPRYAEPAGTRILVAFLVAGVVVFFALRFLLRTAGVGGLPVAQLSFVVALLAAFVVAQRTLVRLPMAEFGLRRFSEWTRRERLYFFQVIPLAAVAFAVVFANHLLALLQLHGLAGFLLFSVLTGLLWGMVQELLFGLVYWRSGNLWIPAVMHGLWPPNMS